MPFVQVDIQKQIEEQRQKDPEFRRLWDEMKRERENNPCGSSWDEFEKELFTPEEIAESDARVEVINETIRAKEKTK